MVLVGRGVHGVWETAAGAGVRGAGAAGPRGEPHGMPCGLPHVNMSLSYTSTHSMILYIIIYASIGSALIVRLR